MQRWPVFSVSGRSQGLVERRDEFLQRPGGASCGQDDRQGTQGHQLNVVFVIAHAKVFSERPCFLITGLMPGVDVVIRLVGGHATCAVECEECWRLLGNIRQEFAFICAAV